MSTALCRYSLSSSMRPSTRATVAAPCSCRTASWGWPCRAYIQDADNIAYMVPAPIIEHVLADLDDGHYAGFPELGLHTQALDNASLKRQVAGRDDISGVLVTHILPGAPADGVLVPGDVLLAVDGHAIADDGTIAFHRQARTSFAYASSSTSWVRC